MSDTTLINDVSINGNEGLTPDALSETLQDNTINALGIDASSRTIWVNGQPYGNAYVNIKDDNTLEAPIGAEIFNDFVNNVASGEYSHAEGYKTTASGNYSHASGLRSKALNASSYAEGYNNESSGNCAHSEGSNNYANADNAHVEGNDNLVEGHESHAEGIHNKVYGNASHAEGNGNRVLGDFSHVEGTLSVAYSHGCHAEGYGCGAGDLNQKDILDPTLRTDSAAHAEGIRTIASGMGSHSEGLDTHASGIGSHAEGTGTYSRGSASHAEGVSTKSGVKGYYIKGIDFKNKKIYLTTEQVTSVKTSGFLSSDIENINIPYTLGVPLSIYNGKTYDGIIATSYKNNIIFVESLPFQNVVSITEEDIKPYDFTLYSLEEYKFGGVDLAYGSHSEGSGTRAFGYSSHASGIDSYASGIASHSSGFNTKSTNDYEFSVGKWNKSNDGTIFSIGIGEKGTSEDIDINRKNAFEVYSNGNININEGDVNINKNATINGSFDVNGTIKLLGTTYIGTSDSPKNLNIRGDLGINGNTRIGNSIHEDTLTINATTTANAAITAPEFIGKLTGNADSSTKLRDTRQFNVDLSSDNKTLFDGTNDCTMGVTGTLDVPNGGTGRTSFTKFGILYGNAEEQIKSSAAPIRENQVLLSKLTTNTTGEAVYTPVWRDQFYINEIKKIESNTGGIDITLDIEGKDSANQPYEDISVNIPLASKNTYAGLISNVNQSFAGTKTFDDINIDQKLEVSGNTILHNTVTVNDILTVNGDATFNGVANILGNTTIGKLTETENKPANLTVNGNIIGKQDLDISGIATLDQLDVTNDTTIGGTLGVDSNTTIGGTLGVTGHTTVTTLESTENVDLKSLDVIDDTTIGGTLGISGKLIVGEDDGTISAENKEKANILVYGGGMVLGDGGFIQTGNLHARNRLIVRGEEIFLGKESGTVEILGTLNAKNDVNVYLHTPTIITTNTRAYNFTFNGNVVTPEVVVETFNNSLATIRQHDDGHLLENILWIIHETNTDPYNPTMLNNQIIRFVLDSVGTNMCLYIRILNPVGNSTYPQTSSTNNFEFDNDYIKIQRATLSTYSFYKVDNTYEANYFAGDVSIYPVLEGW